jgi:hypothetical protein
MLTILQFDTLLGQLSEDALGIGKRRIPGIDLHHLRADMERHAVGLKAELVGVDEHVDGHLRHAAELARQRPFGTFAIRQHAAEHASRRERHGRSSRLPRGCRRQRDRNAERMRAGNVAFLLDRVAVGDPVRRRTCVERHLDFRNRGAVEARTERGEQLQDFRRRVCLDGIVDRAVGQGVAERVEVVAHDIEVDDEAGAFGASGLDEIENTSGRHLAVPQNSKLRRTGGQRADEVCDRASRWRPRRRYTLIRANNGSAPCHGQRSGFVCHGLEGLSHRTSGNDGVPLQ